MPSPAIARSPLVYAAAGLAAGVLFVILLVVAVVGMAQSGETIDRLRDASRAALSYESALARADAAHRTYLVTGRAETTTAYNAAVERFENARASLLTTLREGPVAPALQAELTRTGDLALADWRRTVVVRDTQGLEPLQREGPAIGARTDGALAALTHARTQLDDALAQESQRARHSRFLAILWASLAAIAIAATLTALIVLVVRETRQRLHLQSAVSREAHHDPVTSLPNRRFFNEWLGYALATARRDGEVLGLLLIAVDAREVSIRGDAMAPAVAKRLRALKRESDLLARLDEHTFALAAPRPKNRQNLARLGDRILHALREPPLPGAALARIAPCLGIAIYPDDADDLPGLVAAADSALTMARHDPFSPIVFNSPSPG